MTRTLYDLWERPQIPLPECQGSIALQTHCGNCPRCISEASGIVLKWRFTPGDQIPKHILTAMAFSMIVLLHHFGSQEKVSRFIVEAK